MSRLLDVLFRLTETLYQKYEHDKHVRWAEKRTLKSFEKVKDKRKLTEAQAKEVKTYYKKMTGIDVPLTFHEYFYSRTGVYSKEYMPVGLFEADLIGRANQWKRLSPAYSDKNMDEIYLPHILHPVTILKNINGYFYYKGRPVSKEEAISLCGNIESAIIKPSMQSKGKGVNFLNVKNGITNLGEKTIEEVFNEYHVNYLIQEKVTQHNAISALNPSSVNTIRIMTYRSGMEVIVVYAVIRIGRSGQIIDNQSAGGISTVIHEDGRLGKYAFGVAGDDKIEKTDSGIVLENYKIPGFSKAIEAVKKSHFDLPFFDIVGWDISINENEEPVLIEWNGNAGPSQTACGTGLGKYTDKILSELMPRKNTRIFVYSSKRR